MSEDRDFMDWLMEQPVRMLIAGVLVAAVIVASMFAPTATCGVRIKSEPSEETADA